MGNIKRFTRLYIKVEIVFYYPMGNIVKETDTISVFYSEYPVSEIRNIPFLVQ
jgi:hypothetical protein